MRNSEAAIYMCSGTYRPPDGCRGASGSGLGGVFRTAAVGLLLVLGVFAAGCGPSEEGKTRLVLMVGGGQVRDVARDAVARFERDFPQAQVQIISVPGGDYYVKGLTMLAGRAHLDVIWMGQGFGMFASRNALLDLSPYLEADPDFNADAFYGEVLDWYRFGDNLYGIPYGIDIQVIAYNKDLFDAAGLAYPNPDWTIDDMVSIGRELTRDLTGDGRINQYGLGMGDLRPTYFGLDLLTPDNRSFGLNNPAGVEWLELNRRLLVDEGILRRSGDQEALDRKNEFLNQRVAIIDFFTWDLEELRTQANFRWDLVPVPRTRDGDRVVWASSSGFCIAGHTRHPDFAWELLRYLVDAEVQEAMSQIAVPAIRELQSAYLESNPPPPDNLRAVLDSLDDLLPLPRIAAQREVYTEWDYWNEMVMQGRLEPAEALEKAEAQINRILEVHRAREARPR